MAIAVRACFVGAVMGAGTAVPDAWAQTEPTQNSKTYSVAPGSLEDALNSFARQAGITLSFDPALVVNKQSLGLNGSFTVDEALARLLAPNGLAAVASGTDAFTIRTVASPGPTTVLPAVKVQAQADRLFDPPPEQGGFKADFQDSATKTPLSIRETPQAISVITQDSIEARQSTNLASALELAASVIPVNSSSAFSGIGIRNGDRLSLRGQILNNNRDIRTDGFALPTHDTTPADLALFERIEVVKGPSSVLYGQSSVAGFINRIRKKPQSERAISIVGQAGSFDTYRTEVDAAGALSAEHGVDGRLIGVFSDAGAFVDGVDSRRYMVAPSVSAELGERTRLLVQTQFQQDDYIVNPGIPLRRVGNELKAPKIPRSRFFGDPGPEGEGRILDLGLQLDHQLSDDWLTTLRLNRYDFRGKNPTDNYGYGLYDNGLSTVYSAFRNREVEFWSGELRLNGSFEALGRKHQLTAGFERRDSDDHSTQGYQSFGQVGNIYEDNFDEIETIPGVDTPLQFDSTTDTIDEGAYVQLVLSPADRTKIVVGGRYDRSRQRTDNALSDSTSRLDKDAWTYRIGGTQELTGNVSMYVMYAQSFAPVTSLGAGGKVLEPETGEGFETGLKSEWFEQRLSATLAVFRQERDDVPIPNPDDRNFSISSGLQRTDGVELELSGSPAAGLTIGSALSWLDGKHTERDDPSFGQKPNGTVRRQSNVYVRYILQSGVLHGLGAGATLISLGDRFQSGGTFSEGYERVDLNLSYDALPGWDLSLQVRNLLDETYLEIANRGGYQNYFGAPRAVLFRAEYRFRL